MSTFCSRFVRNAVLPILRSRGLDLPGRITEVAPFRESFNNLFCSLLECENFNNL